MKSSLFHIHSIACNVVGTPSSSFGPSGEGFFRLSAFGYRENVNKSVDRIKMNLKYDKCRAAIVDASLLLRTLKTVNE